MRTLNFVIVLIVFTSFVVASEPLRSTDILDFYPYTKELSIGETYQANYKFNFKPESFEVFLIKPDLSEYKPGVIFVKLKSIDYLYVYIPEEFKLGEYKLSIKSKHLINNFLKENIYEEIFKVKNELGIRIINPFVFLEGKNEFRVSLLNLGNMIRTVELKEDNYTMPFRDSVEIKPNERKDLLFKVKDNNFDVSYLSFFVDSLNSSINDKEVYQIPLIGKEVIGNVNVERKDLEIPKIVEETDSIKFLNKKDNIDLILRPKEEKSGFVQFLALKDLLNVDVLLSGDVKEIVDVNISQIGSLFKDQVYNLKIEVNKERNALSGIYDGFLNILFDGGSVNMKINIKVLDETSNETEIINQTENIIGTTKPKTTLEKKEEKPTDARYLIVAFFILLIIVYLFYKISRTAGKPKNVKEFYGKFGK